MADNYARPNYSQMYPGWGINSNPNDTGYDSPYRPGVKGPNPYGAYQNKGFGHSLNFLLNPFASDPYWGAPGDNYSQASANITRKTSDATANVTQQFIMPALMFGLANRAFTEVGSKLGRGMAMGAATRMGMGAMAGVAGGAGAFAGSFMLPLAVGYAATAGIDELVFQPYMRHRMMTNSIQQNFGARYFGEGMGDPITGRGIRGSEAAKMAGSIHSQGTLDRTFSSSQYIGMADMGMRAGLFDDVGAKGIPDRVRSIANQVKMIMAISKDSSFQSAIEELSKLRMSGASIHGGVNSQASNAYQSIGMNASIAGVAIQRLNDVRNQGNYAYRAAGLTPFLGEMAAASGYAGFAVAEQMGIMSPAHLARLGGKEGASNSYTSALISASMTMYNQMSLMNQKNGGRYGGSAVSVASEYGRNAARDPLGARGDLILYGGALRSAQAKSDRGLGPEIQAKQRLKDSGAHPMGANGEYSDSQLATAMQGMGMSNEDIQGYLSARGNDTNPLIVAKKIAAIQEETRNLTEQAINQGMLWGGPVGKWASMVTNRVLSKINTVNEYGNAINTFVEKVGESIGTSMHELAYGSTLKRGSSPENTIGSITQGLGSGIKGLKLVGQAQKALTDSAASGDLEKTLQKSEYSELRAALSKLSPLERKRKVSQLARQSLSAGTYSAAHLAASGYDTLDKISKANGGSFYDKDQLNLPEDITAEQYSNVTKAKRSSIESIADIMAKSVGSTGREYVEALAKMDQDSANTQLQAAKMNLDAAEKMKNILATSSGSNAERGAKIIGNIFRSAN